MAEIQYQVDEMVFKMNALTGVSNLPEKPMMYFTDSDTTYGGPGVGAEDALSCGGSEVRSAERLSSSIHSVESRHGIFCTLFNTFFMFTDDRQINCVSDDKQLLASREKASRCCRRIQLVISISLSMVLSNQST